MKNMNFRDLRYSQPAISAKIKIVRTEMHQSIYVLESHWQTIQFRLFLHTAVIKRELEINCIHCFKGGFE